MARLMAHDFPYDCDIIVKRERGNEEKRGEREERGTRKNLVRRTEFLPVPSRDIQSLFAFFIKRLRVFTLISF